MPRSATRATPSRQSSVARTVTAHILVATDGSDSVAPEIAAARALADRDGSTVDVVSVTVPVVAAPVFMDMGLVGPMNPTPDLEGRRHRIRDELARAGRPNWPVSVVAGFPAEKIAETARKIGATLIVMGIGRHAPIDRLMGSETALQVIQHADVPVLAVARGPSAVPTRALAAVDFTTQSETAARLAGELLTDDGTLSLAHVRSDWVESIDPLLPVDIYAAGVERKFDELERRLSVRHAAPRVVERGVGSGEVAPELLRIAADRKVDLIAVGAHTHSRLERIFLGSVSAKLLRGAHCSVLVIPARAEATRSASRRRATVGRTTREKT